MRSRIDAPIMNVTSKRHHLHCCLIALHISESTTSNCSLDGKPPGASNRKYSISTWQESAALRDFGPAYDRLGSKPELPSNGLMSALASCGHSGGNAYRRFVPLGDLSRCNNVRGNCGYSITSSARPSREIGKVMPSALAVFRLRTSSTFVDCCTGRSPGFSPLRMRPT